MKKKDGDLGCCSIVFWEAMIIIMLACTYLPASIHIIFRVLLGLVGFGIFVVLLLIPYVGMILNIGLGVFWAFLIWEGLDINEWGFVSESFIWEWAVRILLNVVCIFIHIISVIHMKMGFDTPSFPVNKRTAPYSQVQREILEDLIRKEQQEQEQQEQQYQRQQEQRQREQQYQRQQEQRQREWQYQRQQEQRQREWQYQRQQKQREQQYQRQQMEKNNNSDEQFDLFAGCLTKDSVTKRYKDLSKSYHPDSVNGDTAQMQKLNQLYEKKLKEVE